MPNYLYNSALSKFLLKSAEANANEVDYVYEFTDEDFNKVASETIILTIYL